MIKVGTKTYQDDGFYMSTAKIGGTTREVLNVELKQGLTTQALNALLAGPITIVGDDGTAQGTVSGPFVLAGLSLKLMRESADDDVEALSAELTGLRSQLTSVNSAKENALNQLASLSQQLQTLMDGTSEASDNEEGTAEVSNATDNASQ